MNIENFGIVLKDFNKLAYEKIEYDYENIPEDYLLIENKAIGLGPYDTGFITGRLKTTPFRELNIGCEGSGIVIKLGKNCDESLKEKKVAYLVSYHDVKCIRSFANYSVVHKSQIIILNENIDFNQGAYLLGNPLTAKGLLDSVINKSKTRAIIQDTSSSSLGKMITKICLKENIKIINIVRKDENLKLLEEIGSTKNLNSNNSNFISNLEQYIQELNPDIYITYQGGNLPSRIIDKMPNNSRMVCCGNINNQKLEGFSTTDFIFKGKVIEGFQILNYLSEISTSEKENLYNYIIQSFSVNNSELYTNILKEYNLKDFELGYEVYKNNCSLGKIIFKP